MRVLVTGATGMLGSQLLRCVPGGPAGPDGSDGFEAVAVTRADADLADAVAVRDLFLTRGPFGGVIHTAGYNAVDDAETNLERAYRDNGVTTRELAAACGRAGIPFVLVSTDYVFDGLREAPYPEDAPAAPLNAYGRSKYAAERAARAVCPLGARIVRTAWLYGPGGRHFPGRILELARAGRPLRVVDDQRGSPTSTLELAPALWDVLSAPAGLYHAACEGSCSWYELARATLEIAGVDAALEPCTTAETPRPAARPAYSVLDSGKLAARRGAPLMAWRDALKRYLGSKSQ